MLKVNFLDYFLNNELSVKSIYKKEGVVKFSCCVKGVWKKYFQKEEFVINYEENISSVPDGILIIPFLSNILPIAWLCDALIKVNEIDRVFYDQLDCIKESYAKMYPMFEFKGGVIPRVIESYDFPIKKDEKADYALFFSAGVDSFSSLVNHLNESPFLICLRGSDFPCDDEISYKRIEEKIKYFNKKTNSNLIYQFVTTNFRKVIDYGKLDKLVKESNDSWWHGFQHGIAIISHAAPLAYLHKFKIIYIASSFTPKQKGKVTCASDPTIDESLKFFCTSVVHDGYEFDRLQKVQQIVDFSKDNNMFIPLHVCWETTNGENCSRCEKCARTMLEIYACEEDPRAYGFNPSLLNKEAIMKKKQDKVRWAFNYLPIIQRLKVISLMNNNKLSKEVEWILDLE